MAVKKGMAGPAGLAILAAVFYALNAPFSKLLLRDVDPSAMASLLYLGAGVGMALLLPLRRGSAKGGSGLTRADVPYAAAMVALDIAAPVLLMNGLTRTSSANAALLNNFEIVATSLIAFVVFREQIDRRLWCAIGVVTVASMLLSVEDAQSLAFSGGSLLVLLACVCWGFENNCTRMMSHGDPLYIVVIKGLGSGAGAAVVAWLGGEALPALPLIPLAMLLGFVSYGLSVYCYVYAQRSLGAARTSAYYAIAPFVGVGISFLMFRDKPGPLFIMAFVLMLWGSWLLSVEPKPRRTPHK
ncbi:MAG: DMT family transporter [Aristaeellaceae bacterium]